MPQSWLARTGSSPRVPRRVLPSIGLLYALPFILLLPGVAVFEQAWGYDHHWVGFFVNVLTFDSLRKEAGPYLETVVFLSVDEKGQWSLNGQKITPNEIQGALIELRGDRANCLVFLDVDSSLPYAAAIHAIDLIAGTGFNVILVTPGTKRMRIP